MYLIIYKKKDKYYFQTADNINKTYKAIHDFEEIKLTKKYKIASFKIGSLNGLWNLRKNLKEFGFMVYIMEVREKDKTYILGNIDLMNNPLFTAKLCEKDEENDIEETQRRYQLITEIKDYEEVQKSFNFNHRFGFDLMGINC